MVAIAATAVDMALVPVARVIAIEARVFVVSVVPIRLNSLVRIPLARSGLLEAGLVVKSRVAIFVRTGVVALVSISLRTVVLPDFIIAIAAIPASALTIAIAAASVIAVSAAVAAIPVIPVVLTSAIGRVLNAIYGIAKLKLRVLRLRRIGVERLTCTGLRLSFRPRGLVAVSLKRFRDQRALICIK